MNTFYLWLCASEFVTDQAMTIRVAVLMVVGALLMGLSKALGPDSARIPWNLSAPIRALAVALLSALGNGIASAITGDPLWLSLLFAVATAAPAWGQLAWTAVFSAEDAKASVTGQKNQPPKLIVATENHSPPAEITHESVAQKMFPDEPSPVETKRSV